MNLNNKKLIKDFGPTSFLWSGGMGGGAGGVSEELLTTKGDTHGYTTENARVPVGVDGQVVTADSTDPLGLAWATPSGASASDSITAGGITATLGDWVLVDTYVPSALTSLVATTVDDTSIALTYNSITGERVKTVQVDYSTDNITWTTATTTAGITSYTITGLTSGTPYYIRVYPTNIIGQGLVTAVAGTTSTHIAPNTPASFTLAAGASPPMSVDVSWNLSTIGNPAPLYTLERSADNITFSVLSSTISAVTTTYNDSTNPTDTLIYYRLKATNVIGSSAYTATESINIPFNPVTSYGTGVLNEGGVISGYNTYTYLNNGASDIVLSASATVEVLLVGAGGRGVGGGDGLDKGGGGGAGAVMVSNTFTLPAGTHALSVGATNGNSSTFYGITCTGGSSSGNANGQGATRPSGPGTGTAPTFPGGITGTVYAGYTGGLESSGEAGGGGAGSNQNGSQGAGYNGGDAGNGIQLTGFESVSYYYASGGGGSGRAGQGGDGSLGGGGAGAYSNSGSAGSAGTGGRNNGYVGVLNGAGGNGGANTGSGGGGGMNGSGSGNVNSSGGSGIIVIKVTV